MSQTSNKIYETIHQNLRHALIECNVKVAEEILDGNISGKILNVNYLDIEEYSLLLNAVHSDANLPIVTILLERGAYVDPIQPVSRITPLGRAIINSQLKMASKLIECGANVNAILPNVVVYHGGSAKGFKQLSLLGYAFEKGDDHLAKLLFESHAKLTLEELKNYSLAVSKFSSIIQGIVRKLSQPSQIQPTAAIIHSAAAAIKSANETSAKTLREEANKLMLRAQQLMDLADQMAPAAQTLPVGNQKYPVAKVTNLTFSGSSGAQAIMDSTKTAATGTASSSPSTK